MKNCRKNLSCCAYIIPSQRFIVKGKNGFLGATKAFEPTRVNGKPTPAGDGNGFFVRKPLEKTPPKLIYRRKGFAVIYLNANALDSAILTFNLGMIVTSYAIC